MLPCPSTLKDNYVKPINLVFAPIEGILSFKRIVVNEFKQFPIDFQYRAWRK